MTQTPATALSAAGKAVYLHGFSAIDSYLGRPSAAAVHVFCGADLSDLARLFEGLRYPGASIADAALCCDEKTWYFRCEEPADITSRRASFGFLEFYQDCATRRYYDHNGIYPHLSRLRNGEKYGEPARWIDVALNSDPGDAARRIIDGALILARYFPGAGLGEINSAAAEFSRTDAEPGGYTVLPPPSSEEQRLLLIGLLEAANPAAGFELLKRSGFIAAHWQELAALDGVDHSKEFHPEGNVWKHTMEALRYRKAAAGGFDLRLSLGLLLHDAGKPLSQSAGSRRFDGHAELGERQASRFLGRLGFDPPLIRDVCYLVRNHMLPAALPRLPLVRTAETMASPLFPALLELYRCDESSSYKGLDGYYQSSAAYRSFLKYRHNPYRSSDGKKLDKRQSNR
ncbi:MAG: HD domain-containing protein, partial [Treponema sp.]|nr:HD domain-containing protein [Treponema sp.]